MRFVGKTLCQSFFLIVLLTSNTKAQQLKWSSYVGGFGTESSAQLATSKTGSVYLAYTTDNEDSIITSNAAFPIKRTQFSAGVLCKLDVNQSVAWATYLTGDTLSSFNVDRLVYDEKGFIYVVGTFNGSLGLTLVNDSFGPKLGGAEAILVKLDTNGAFIWSRTLSSNGFDLPSVAAIDLNGDIWLAGSIAYPNQVPFIGIPITPNAFQQTANPVNVASTVDEMFIACIDKSGNLLYSSYFGGNGYEDPVDVSVDANNNIHFLLRTSSDNIIDRNNPFESDLKNKRTYIISISKTNFQLNYVASPPLHPNDIPDELTFSKSNTLYILSKTNNLDTYKPIAESVLTNNGNTAIIVQEIDPSFKKKRLWALNGFINNDVGISDIESTDSSLLILLYEKKNLIPTQKNAFQKLNNGLMDAFIFNLGYDFKPKWATYLGGFEDDYPFSVCNNGSINWIVGTTRSNDYYVSKNPISKQLNDGFGSASVDIFLTAFNCKNRNVSIVSNATIACKGTPVVLKANQLFSSYNWNNISTTDSIVVTNDTLIQLQAIDSFGCIYFANSTVTFVSPPKVSSFDTTFCASQTFQFNYTSGKSDSLIEILWSDGSSSKNIQLASGGKYTAVVSNGCFKDSFEINLEEVDCNGKYFVPNAFTPNNDGVNDVFDINGLNIKNRIMNIYNRWGQLVYEANGSISGWDGTFKLKPAPSDVYTYLIYVTDSLGNEQSLKGTLHLIR
ncbi:MAG: gliding motility-associated C-terminal domain-containing protein [Bacteroidia bacterium]|jgi:gliding motility-associated-like protein|nr:gliding motility-associated C-terminal domain-containing protein [Bacteroidia bacterium]